MKPGIIRRRGFDLMALGLGIPLAAFLWVMGRPSASPSPRAIDSAIEVSVYFSWLFWLGLLMVIFGGKKSKR